jgi:hypothetical protein
MYLAMLVGLAMLISAICKAGYSKKRKSAAILPPIPKTSAQPPPQDRTQQPKISTVRVALGPSPWAWTNRSHVMNGRKYLFRALGEGPDFAGVTQVINESNQTVLLLDFGCYARLMHDGTGLLWWEGGSQEARVIEFRVFAFHELNPIGDPFSEAKEMRKRKDHATSLPLASSFSISAWLTEGIHVLKIPNEFLQFEETLVLADHQPGANGWNKACRAIFVFDWLEKKLRVIPQDWFNQGNYDFGYQWIARVARTTGGSIVGDGIRLGNFELDESGKQVKRWLSQNEFHMIT